MFCRMDAGSYKFNSIANSMGGSKFRFRRDGLTPATITDVLRRRGWCEVDGESMEWDVFWCDVSNMRESVNNQRLAHHQRVPHFRNHYELTKKNLLARNLKRHKRLLLREGKQHEAELCDCIPVTFELPREYMMFVEEYRKQPGSTWIVKPSGGSRGMGIFLFKKLKDLMEWRNSKEWWSKDACESDIALHNWVVQRYIEDPYLLGGRKFDLRIYVLVTSFSPLKVWLAREGFARFSGSQYTLDKLQDNAIHLTNMSIQLSSDNTLNHGHKWSLRSVRQFLSARHGNDIVDKLMERIGEVVMISLQSVSSVIMQNIHSFELYGYDILVNSQLTPWLIEVNSSPSMGATDSEDYTLKYNLIDDVLNVLDLEKKLSGREVRVGGFDLLWNDGPVPTVCPGLAGCCGSQCFHKPTQRPNIFLGCYNDRDQQLEQLKQYHNLSHNI